jgi:hypothetical protein
MNYAWSMRWALGLVWVGVSGCFMGYDSRWGQQKQAQRHVAAHETPQQLHRQSVGDAPRSPERTLKLRVYATPGYAATVLDWPKQFAALLECVNGVFTPDFGVAFEVRETKSFRPKADEEKLDGVLQELAVDDSAEDVDWVIGLASAVPRFAASADDLGRAPLLGRHLVMRAMSDVHEYEAIQSAFNELSEAERQNVYRARKQHKLCAVFVHELAHTLGVPHELSASSLMNPRYHVEASGLSEEAAKIVRASLATRARPEHALLDADLARTMHALLRAPNADWEPKSRDVLLALIAPAETNGEAVAASPAPTSGKPATSAPSGPVIEGLSAQEQAAVERARAELSAGRAASARQIAAPIFSAHPNLAALKSLRCDIAMGVGGDWEAIQSECPGLSPFGN